MAGAVTVTGGGFVATRVAEQAALTVVLPSLTRATACFDPVEP